MALYEQFARVGKALANPVRLELLDLLAQGERSVEDLAGTAQMKVSNTSAQLRMLAAAGLVASRRGGSPWSSRRRPRLPTAAPGAAGALLGPARRNRHAPE